MSGPEQGTHSRRRALVLGGAAFLVAALVVALVLVLTSRGEDETAAARPTEPGPTTSAGTPTSSGAAAPSSSGEPAAAPVTGEVAVDELPDSLPTVALDQAVEVDGQTVSLSAIEAVQGVAQGPGNVNGPAVRVTVQLTNGSTADLDLDGVSVNLTHGADLTPGSPLEDASQDLFSGTVAPGATATGVYVFSVPAGALDRVDVTVGVAPGASYAVFSGPVS